MFFPIRALLGERDVVLTFLVMGGATLGLLLSYRNKMGKAFLPSATSIVFAVLIFSVTAVPAQGWQSIFSTNKYGRSAVSGCLAPRNWFDTFGIASAQGLLNFFLFMPLSIALAAATRRPFLVALILPSASFLIEVWQGFSGGRTCMGSDWMANTTGAIIGALIFYIWMIGPGAKEIKS